MVDGQAFVLAQPCLEEAQQRGALAVRVRVDQRLVLRDRRILHRARHRPKLRAQVGPLEITKDAFERGEVEGSVLLDGPPDRAAELLAVKAFQVRAVRQFARQRFEPLKVEAAPVEGIAARLGDHVHDAASGSTELRRGAGRDHLEFLHRFERDVDRRALAACLLAEESVVVVAAVEADVVEDPPLACKGNLVSIRALDDADARCEGQHVLELAPENGNRFDGGLIEGRGRRCARALDDVRRGRHGNRFLHAGHFHHDR